MVWLGFYKSGWIKFCGFVGLIIFPVIAKEQLGHSLVTRLGHFLKTHAALSSQLSDNPVHKHTEDARTMENDIQQEKLPNTNHKMWNIVHINKHVRSPELKLNKDKICLRISTAKRRWEFVTLGPTVIACTANPEIKQQQECWGGMWVVYIYAFI